MEKFSHSSAKKIIIIAFASVLYLYVSICAALPITLEIIRPDRFSAQPTETFIGSIHNNSGSDLLVSDLALNFSGYNPAVISPIQLLGSGNELIRNAEATTLTLFTLDIGPFALPNVRYFTDLFIEDLNATPNFSNIATVSVQTGQVPEPTTLILLGTGFLAICLFRRQKLS
jgi:hypothetical protein